MITPLQRRLIEAAIRAPSGDNCQPWFFRCPDEMTIEVYIVPERAESFFDFEYSATYLSVGAVLANMQIAAAHDQYGLRFEYPAGNNRQRPAAVVHLQPQGSEDEGYRDFYPALWTRTVNRRPYWPGKLAPEIWRALLAVPMASGVVVKQYDDKHSLSAWRGVVRCADHIRWTHPLIHRELFQKIRYSVSEAEQKRDGLEINRLGIGPGAANVMRLLSSWQRFQKLSRFGAVTLLAEQAAMLVRCSSGVVGVWLADDTPEMWIKAGQTTQLLWVKAQRLGLSVQPLPVGMYLERRFRREGKGAFESGHEIDIKNIRTYLNSLRPDLPSAQGAMVFRVGKAFPMRSSAIRYSIERFID